MTTTPTLLIEDIAYHRNGVGGVPFFVVTFNYAERPPRRFIATLFPEYVERDGGKYVWSAEPGYANPRCAVLDRDLLGKGTIAFGENSWRGDRYADQLLAAANAWMAERR